MITTFVVGQMRTNCYIVRHKNGDIVVIDPGDEGNAIAEKVLSLEGQAVAIIATHGHFDHIIGAYELQQILQVPMYMHDADRFLVKRMRETAEHFLGYTIVEVPPNIHGALQDNQEIFGMHVLHIPGHTPGSIAVLCDDGVIVGDSVFADGSVGRTDFSYSDASLLKSSIRTLLTLPEKTVLYPGHGRATHVHEQRVYHTI